MTVQDLMKYCLKHNIDVTIGTISSNMPMVQIKFSDWHTNRHFCRYINFEDLERTNVDIMDYLLKEAIHQLKLDESPEQRKFDAIIEDFKRTCEPDYVKIKGVRIPYSEYKAKEV